MFSLLQISCSVGLCLQSNDERRMAYVEVMGEHNHHQFICKSRLPVRQQSIELAAHDH